MKLITVACHTLKDEIVKVMKDLKVTYPVIWIESGQHNQPEKLNLNLQEQIDRIDNVDYILLLFGNCGNAIQGLSSRECRIVVPRVDDCISLFLGGNQQKRELERESASYYLTRGYMEHESNLWKEYQYCVSRYGVEKAHRLMNILLKHYQNLRIIDTGAYSVEELVKTTEEVSKKLSLHHEVVPGTLEIFYQAFQGEWEERFSVVLPGSSIDFCHIGLE